MLFLACPPRHYRPTGFMFYAIRLRCTHKNKNLVALRNINKSIQLTARTYKIRKYNKYVFKTLKKYFY